MAMSPTSAPFEHITHVLDDFRNSLTIEEADRFGATDLQDLQYSLEAIQNKQRKDSNLQDMRRLERFLHIIESYGDFIGTSDLVAFVWGPMKHLLEVTSGVAIAFNAVVDTYQRIAKMLPLMTEMEALIEADAAMITIMAMFLQDIFVFHLRALQYFKGSVWKHLFHSTWKSFNTRFSAQLEQMSYRKALVETRANMADFLQAKQLHLRAVAEVTRQEQSEALLQKRFVVEWLAPADVLSYQVSGREARRCSPASGEWLLSRDIFRSWYHPPTAVMPLLWVTGIPGAGKTVLASLVIDEVPTITGARVLYFYLRQDDPERDSFVAMARSLIHQAFQHDDALLPYLYEEAAAFTDAHLRSASVAERLLDCCLRALGNTYIVIDGLDEAPQNEQRHIVSWMQRIVEQSASEPESCRCIIFSQNDQSTRPLLSNLPTLCIRVEDNQADIKAYSLSKAQEIARKFSLQDDESFAIAEETTRRANGMFLFARIVMTNLHAQTNRQALYEELNPNVFPVDLLQAYHRIQARLGKAAPSEQKDASKLIAWIACSTRVLKWQEIQCAISADPGRDIVDYDRRKLVLDAKQLCGALVEEMPNGDVCFVHSTVKQSTQTVKPREHHILLASLCLSYLNLGFFDVRCSSQQVERELMNGSYAFFDYAIVSWAEHVMSGLCGSRDTNVANAHRLEEDLDTFFEQHWKTPSKKPMVTKRVIDSVNLMQRNELREKALLSMASLEAIMSMQPTDTIGTETLDVFQISRKVRDVLEKLVMEKKGIATLARYYSRKFFKCSRPYCRWFYEGFATNTEREDHQAKHDRSFRCPVSGCPSATLGFITEKDLEAHRTKYHTMSLFDEFPDEPSESDMPAPTFSCPQCKKEFTRASNLNAHMRTHNETEKPFLCQICQATFARPADLKRHRDTHTSQRSFICHCGKTYKRADALARHKAAAHDGQRPSRAGGSVRTNAERQEEFQATKPTTQHNNTPPARTQTIGPTNMIPRRLINVKTQALEDFSSAHDNPPQYAILSHRWSEAEVTLDEWSREEKEHKVGWAKIKGACWRAAKDGHSYLWVDTCCIDRSSSAELSEAINSMFGYYRDAAVCYVHLADVRGLCDLPENQVVFISGSREDSQFKEMQRSQWFTRGWTLQELLAPSQVEFFSTDWKPIGRLDKIAPIIYAITKIDLAILRKEKSIEAYSFAQRLSWAANRYTTRPEDETYCLLGILGVSLEVTYGRGQAAFHDLQRKLLESGSSDDSIFAWTSDSDPGSLFASSPRCFQDGGDVICWRPRLMSSSFFYRSDGIAAKVYLYRHQQDALGLDQEVALLNCTKGLGSDKVLGLSLQAISNPTSPDAGLEYCVVAATGQHGSTSASRVLSVDRSCIASASLREVTILLKTP